MNVKKILSHLTNIRIYRSTRFQDMPQKGKGGKKWMETRRRRRRGVFDHFKSLKSTACAYNMTSLKSYYAPSIICCLQKKYSYKKRLPLLRPEKFPLNFFLYYVNKFVLM